MRKNWMRLLNTNKDERKTGFIAVVVATVVNAAVVVAIYLNVAVALMLPFPCNFVAASGSLLPGFTARCNNLFMCATSPFAAGGRLRSKRVYSP